MGNKSSVQRSFDEESLGQSPEFSPQCVVSKAAPDTKGKDHAATSQRRRRRSLLSLHNILRKTSAEYREGHKPGSPSDRPTDKPDKSRFVSGTTPTDYGAEADPIMDGSRSSTMQKILPRVQLSMLELSHEADSKTSRAREGIATTERRKYDLPSKEEELHTRKQNLCPLSGPGGGNSPTDILPYNTLVTPTRKGEQISINDFDLLKVLGRGSFGKVMLVKKKSDGKLYAMKSLRKSTLIMKNQLMHTKTEREILQNMQHPFLVKLQYAFQSESKLYLVIDFVGGGELFFWLRKFKRFSEATARLFAAEMLLALECLHDHGVVYRDLKPENILIDARGHIKITDFGFCKQISRRSKNVECQCWRAAKRPDTFTGHAARSQIAHAPNKARSPKLEDPDSASDITINATVANAGTGSAADTARTFGANSNAGALSYARSSQSEGSRMATWSHSRAEAAAIISHGRRTDSGSDEIEKSSTQRPTTLSKRRRPPEPQSADLSPSPPVLQSRDPAQVSPLHKLPARAGPRASNKLHTNCGICPRCGKVQRNPSPRPREGSATTDTNAFATDVPNTETENDLASGRGKREDIAERMISRGITVGSETNREVVCGGEKEEEHHHLHHYQQQQLLEQEQQHQRQHPREPDHIGEEEEEEDVEGSTSSFAGTPEYLAPEIIRRQRHGKAVDWWTLGALIFEMLTGLPPFYHRNRLRMYRRILQEPLVLPPTLSSAARSLISSLLHRDANLRLGSRGGAAEIKAHPFFAGLDFDKVLSQQYRPPFLPPLDRDIAELAFFDPECVAEPARDSPVVRKISDRSKMRIREVLRDFSYSGNITNVA